MCVTNTLLRRKTLSIAGLNVSSPLKTTENKDSIVLATPVSHGSSSTYATQNARLKGLLINTAPWCNWSSPVITSSDDSIVVKSKGSRPAATRERRRKPQRPGKTAKHNQRHFVVHNYHDHTADLPVQSEQEEARISGRRGGVSVFFPIKLHEMLDQIEADGYAHVISWQPHGRAFLIHDPVEFASHVMPKYFKHTKITSFQRQLNLYGFCRLTKGRDSRAYYHELFLRVMPSLCCKMTRVKIKGTGFKAASSPEQEPDFYAMPPATVTPPDSGASEHDSMDSDSEDATVSLEPAEEDRCVSPFRTLPSTMVDPVVSFDASIPPLPTEVQGSNAEHESYYSSFVPCFNDGGEDGVMAALEKMFAENETESAFGDDDDGFDETWGSTMASTDMELFETLDSDVQLGSLLEGFMA